MPASGTGVDLFGARPGRRNGLADVPGIGVGHAPVRDEQRRELSSGVTVVACPGGAVGAVDVRGGGPGTRETDLLKPSNTMQHVHAIALCGGSAFGLDAAGGVMAGLEVRGIGYPVFGDAAPHLIVPIVPAAVIFDLAVGDPRERPDAACGREAVEAALAECGAGGQPVAGEPGGGGGHRESGHGRPGYGESNCGGSEPGASGPSGYRDPDVHGADAAQCSARGAAENGCVGAGRAASAGAVKGGFGQASAVIGADFPPGLVPGAGWTIAVGLVANPAGSVIDPATGWPWGLGAQLHGEFERYWADGVPDPAAGGLAIVLARGLGGTKLPVPGGETGGAMGAPMLNTTIGVVATDAPLTKAQAERLAMAAHDGLARAVRPAHLPMDGDTFFALATGQGGQGGRGGRGGRGGHGCHGGHGDDDGDGSEGSQIAAVSPEELAVLAAVAADCAERAVVHAVLAASSAFGVPSWTELMR